MLARVCEWSSHVNATSSTFGRLRNSPRRSSRGRPPNRAIAGHRESGSYERALIRDIARHLHDGKRPTAVGTYS
jgi:hypothetical protein